MDADRRSSLAQPLVGCGVAEDLAEPERFAEGPERYQGGDVIETPTQTRIKRPLPLVHCLHGGVEFGDEQTSEGEAADRDADAAEGAVFHDHLVLVYPRAPGANG